MYRTSTERDSFGCLLCKETNHPVVIQEDGFSGKKCEQCSVIYISPRPDRTHVADIYGHTQAHIAAESHITDSWFKRLHARHTLRLLKKYKPSGDLLEIGAGGGFFLNQARMAGFTPFAIELNPIQANFIANKLTISCEQKPLSMQSFGEQQFDVIYHCDVISHFFDPLEDFKIMHEKLKPGGVVLFETGNIAEVAPTHFGKFPSFQYPDHLFFFGERSLRMLLEQTGFKSLGMKRYNIEGHLFLQRLTKSKSAISVRPDGAKRVEGNERGGVRTLVKTAYHGACYASRYQLGKLIPDNTRPQTLLLVAQKI